MVYVRLPWVDHLLSRVIFFFVDVDMAGIFGLGLVFRQVSTFQISQSFYYFFFFHSLRRKKGKKEKKKKEEEEDGTA